MSPKTRAKLLVRLSTLCAMRAEFAQLETASAARAKREAEQHCERAEDAARSAIDDWGAYAKSGAIDPRFLAAFAGAVAEAESAVNARRDSLKDADAQLQTELRRQGEAKSQKEASTKSLRQTHQKLRQRQEEDALDALLLMRAPHLMQTAPRGRS